MLALSIWTLNTWVDVFLGFESDKGLRAAGTDKNLIFPRTAVSAIVIAATLHYQQLD